MDGFAVTRLVIGVGFLLVAAVADVRTRRVPDPLWIGLGSIGLVVLAVELIQDQIEVDAWALLGSAGLLFFAIFYGDPLSNEDGFHSSPFRLLLPLPTAVLFVYAAVQHSASGASLSQGLLELYSMPAMILVYQLFYRVRILHGGADAKALIALGLLVPTYPDMAPFPLMTLDPRVETFWRVTFPFSLVVWVDAAVLFLAVPLGLLLVNAARGDLALPQALLGDRARLDSFPHHAWLMEKSSDGGDHHLVLVPKRGRHPAQDLKRLRAAGIDRAWVTPQIPFMVPLCGGFLLAFFVGEVLLGFLRLVG